MWLGLGVVLVLLAVRVALNYLSVRHYLRLPLIERVTIAGRLPSVSIIVPARNEAEDLPRLLESLNKLDYPGLDVTVVDDGSIDDTAELASRYGANVVRVDGPPPDWTGHALACWTGAREVLGEWLLFTTARTVHQPESLKRIMSFALERSVSGVSALIQQRAVTFWERVLLPFAYQQWFVGLSPDRVNRPSDPRALATSQYILVEREGYFRAGGHQALGGSSGLEGVALATALKTKGVLVLAARAERQAEIRPYHGPAELRADLAAKAGAVLRAPGAITVVLGTLLANLAWPCLIYGLVAGGRVFILAALVCWVTAVAELFLWNILLQVPITDAVWQPLAALVSVLIALGGVLGPRRAPR